jgi:hypothetical protein
MRVSLAHEARFFWRCAKAIRAERHSGVAMDDDYIDEIQFMLNNTEHNKVREHCAALLSEVQQPELKRIA